MVTFVHLVFPQMSSADLLAYLADELDGDGQVAETPDVQMTVRRIKRFLTANVAKGQHAVVAIDERASRKHAHARSLAAALNFELKARPR